MRYSLAWIVAAVLLSTSAAHAQTGAATDALQRGTEEAAGRIFTDEQIRIIRDVLGTATGQDVSRDDRDRRGQGRDARGRGDRERDARGRGGKPQGLPPGLAKRDTLPPGLARGEDSLPPGIQKRLARGGSLPPGLARDRLPPGLEAQLGRPAVGTERVIVDNDVVLIEKGTEIILDIVKDVLTGGDGG